MAKPEPETAEMVEWWCMGCEHHEMVVPVGHHLCSNCFVYGFDFDYATWPPPEPITPEVQAEEFPLPPAPCQGCSDAEWAEYAKMFPELAKADAEHHQRRKETDV